MQFVWSSLKSCLRELNFSYLKAGATRNRSLDCHAETRGFTGALYASDGNAGVDRDAYEVAQQVCADPNTRARRGALSKVSVSN